MHLSAASKLKTIGLFGPTNDKIYAPKGKNCFVILLTTKFRVILRNGVELRNLFLSFCFLEVPSCTEKMQLGPSNANVDTGSSFSEIRNVFG